MKRLLSSVHQSTRVWFTFVDRRLQPHRAVLWGRTAQNGSRWGVNHGFQPSCRAERSGSCFCRHASRPSRCAGGHARHSTCSTPFWPVPAPCGAHCCVSLQPHSAARGVFFDPIGSRAMSYAPPRYTQTPNSLLDTHMPDMGEAELKVVLAVVRQTFGWHKRKDKISLSQLEELTGLTRKSVIAGIEQARERGVLDREEAGTSYVYWLRVGASEEEEEGQSGGSGDTPPASGGSGAGTPGGSGAGTPVGSGAAPPTKERLKERKKEKEPTHPSSQPSARARGADRGQGGGWDEEWKRERLLDAGVMPSQAEEVAAEADPEEIERMVSLYEYRKDRDDVQSPGWIVWALNHPDKVDVPDSFERTDRSWTPEPIDRDEQPSKEEVRALLDETLSRTTHAEQS